MIGGAGPLGGRAMGIGATVVLGVLLTLRPAAAGAADPTMAAERRAVLRALAAADDRALSALIAQLQAAVDAGRRGSALVIDGTRPAAPDLQQAAAAARAALPLVGDSARADTALDGALPAIQPQLDVPPGPGSAELVGVDGQLDAAASASGPFIERRLAAARTLTALRDALRRLEANHAAAALTALDRADDARRTVAVWPNPPDVLPFWLDTTGAMLDAARDIADATLSGDAAEAHRAGRAYRLAAQDAQRADTALAIAISESGASLASVPLGRLADALEAATDRAAAMASVLHS
ncbi:MAG TPA: hypothetical protein VHU77_03650 [Candidatus Limnocylindria bacterium]|nr:hypothetical protein [Candidatus Limnocylindria bacterium]